MTQNQQPPDSIKTVTDARGRILALKRPNVLAQYRLVDALGDSAANRVYLAMCVPVLYLSAIDEQPVSQPSTKREIEALIQRLDDDGLKALNDAIVEHFSTSDQAEVTSAKK